MEMTTINKDDLINNLNSFIDNNELFFKELHKYFYVYNPISLYELMEYNIHKLSDMLKNGANLHDIGMLYIEDYNNFNYTITFINQYDFMEELKKILPDQICYFKN